jgi:hypothetical protein
VGDWLHINSVSLTGPNRHFDASDARFHPDNLIWGSREANIIAITDRKTDNIMWRLGPAYDGSEAERGLASLLAADGPLHRLHLDFPRHRYPRQRGLF